MITLETIKKNKDISTMIRKANDVLAEIGYTEHGYRHVGYVSHTAGVILEQLGYDERTVELARIAGWVHDVGNAVNRKNHGLTGAAILYPVLTGLGMSVEESMRILSAVGYHEEEHGKPVSEISAAMILADKSDAHRTRVRKGGKFDINDIHDRVNYSIKDSRINIDVPKKIIYHEIEMDSSSSIMEYMQIFLSRMMLSEKAARYLRCQFSLVVNGFAINNHR